MLRALAVRASSQQSKSKSHATENSQAASQNANGDEHRSNGQLAKPHVVRLAGILWAVS